MRNLVKIINLSIYLGLIAILIPLNYFLQNEPQIVSQDSSYNFLVKPVAATNQSIASPPVYPPCDGQWVEGENYSRVDLQTIFLNKWGENTTPAILSETLYTENTVVIGHNVCIGDNCYSAGSSFSGIINLKEGNEMRMCDGKNLYVGKILQSKAISEKDTYVLDSWTGFPTVTMFTSYGECKDSRCSSTLQRWMVVFNKGVYTSI